MCLAYPHTMRMFLSWPKAGEEGICQKYMGILGDRFSPSSVMLWGAAGIALVFIVFAFIGASLSVHFYEDTGGFVFFR